MVFELITKRYLSKGVSTTAALLYTNRMIQRAVEALLGIFVPLFLFQHFGSIHILLVYYLFSFGAYLLLAPLGASIATRLNFKNALIISVLGGSLMYASFYFFDYHLLIFSIIALVAINIDRMFYWMPYHATFAKYTDKVNRGRIMAFFSSLQSLITVLLPLIAGFIVTIHGFEILFLIGVGMYLMSALPFLLIPPIQEGYSFGYFQSWKILFHPQNRRMMVTYMGVGMYDMVSFAIWPIFIWQILEGNYEAVGLLTATVVLFSILFQLLMGRLTDSFDKRMMIRYGSVLYSIGWILKVFVQGPLTVFWASAYHTFTAVMMQSPFDALIYEKAADAGHYVDEYTVMREMSLNMGRVLMIILMLGLFTFFGLNAAFVLAALAALIINLI